MASSTIHKIAIQAIIEGRKPETPVMLVHNVSYSNQKEYFSTLDALSKSDETYPTPLIIVIGKVVELSNLPTEIPQNSVVEKDDYDDFMGSLNQTHLNWGI
jgi:siroheme synthase